MTTASIITNAEALLALRNLNQTNRELATTQARISTGLKINSAIDDAAGLQISQRQEAEIRGFKQATKNAADSQALLATAEGAMGEITNILQRMRELAVQSASGTMSTADRTALQSEVEALETEIDRIKDDTTWAGKSLLNASENTDGSFVFHVGPDASDTTRHTIPTFVQTGTAIGLASTETVSTQAKARAYITAIDQALSNVSVEREQAGAVMNRLDFTMANLSNMATNLALAKGRIEDADFAAESANLARTQVLQQASMAMLAQANASKQQILALFQ